MSAARHHPLYPTWQGMLRRCSNPKHSSYHRYGGRGIKVCELWANDFWCFVADMGDRPVGCTLDRIDNNGHYEPENCRWATWAEQGSNKAPRREFTWRGLTFSIQKWAQITGISAQALNKRLRTGWPVDRVFSEPMKTDSPELMRAAASRAGKSVAAEKRFFSLRPDIARAEAAKGGAAVAPEKRSFSFDRNLATSAARKSVSSRSCRGAA